MTCILDLVPFGMLGILNVYPVQCIFKKDAKLLPNDRRAFLENKVNELKQKLGVERKIDVLEIKEGNIGEAWGNNLLSLRVGIGINPSYFMSPDSNHCLEAMLAHEICHIKHNDTLRKSVIGAVVIIISNIALDILFFPLAAIICAIGVVAMFRFAQWTEECADKAAFSVCSLEGKKAMIQLFKNIKNQQLDYRNEKNISFLSQLWRKIEITEEGDCRLDVLHPPLKTRIKYLKELLTPQGTLQEVCVS